MSAENTPPSLFRHEAMRMVSRVLTENADALARAHLRAESRERSIDGPLEDNEISVYFWRDDDVFDVLEFHTIQSGRPVDSLEALTAWFTAQMTDVLEATRYR
jgi:hypothetical protein